MFNKDFFPTPDDVIETMMTGISVEGKNILEPSAGSGNIVDWLTDRGANVIACESEPRLREILKGKCAVISNDFLDVTSEQVSHIDLIVMNPPFSRDEHHILHAYNIAPAGCRVIALCNWQTVDNDDRNRYRRELKSIITSFGHAENLGDAFSSADRKTKIEIGLVDIQKPGASYDAEFEGFFLNEEPEESQSAGLLPYNFVRDLVNRYVAAVKIYDDQLDSAVRLNSLLDGFYGESIGFQCTQEGKPLARAEFKKQLQKAGWQFIFQKMNMEKYTTKGLREDINKFVESQQNIPFTMRNIYRMLEIIIATNSQRMDKALLEVFDRITMHYHENRYNVEGWKTNSHYLVNKKFILDGLVAPRYGGGLELTHYGDSRRSVVEDFQKALCFITGRNFDDVGSMWSYFYKDRYEFGGWYEWGFFRWKGYKKGTMHFEFLDLDVWARFNQEIARLKGYPLFEAGGYRRKTKHAA